MADPVTSLPEASTVKAVNKTAKASAVDNPNTADKDEVLKSDQVQLTKTLESIETLSTALAEGGAVDKEKVEKIRAAIAAGEYSIDADRIARKFVELEKLLRD